MTIRGKLITVDKDQVLKDAIRLMDKHKVSRVLVTDRKRIVGIITEKDILRRLGTGRERKLKTGRIHVSGVMTKGLITVPSGTRATKIARLMLQKNISSVGVEDRREVVDVVTKTDLIKDVRDSKKSVRNLYTKDPETVVPGDTIVMARKLILKEGIHRIPVMVSGKLAGILTLRDMTKGLDLFREALDIYPQADIKRLRVEHMMTRDPKVINDEQTVGEAVKIMLKENISGLPVVGEEFGILTKTDLIRGIADGLL